MNEAILAYENKALTLQTRIKVRMTKTMPDGQLKTGTVESTLGRFLFNEILPQDLGFVDRSIPENELKLEVDFHVGKKQLKQILEKLSIHTEQPRQQRFWMISKQQDTNTPQEQL